MGEGNVQVETEESKLQEVHHEDLEDKSLEHSSATTIRLLGYSYPSSDAW
jgi:hypothetical protein